MVQIMGLYNFRDFLTFEDVADYLKDKGVYDFDLSYESDYRKLEMLLIEWVRFEKITPVFYNRSTIDVISYQYDDNYNARIKCLDGAMRLEGYYSIDPTAYEFILEKGKIETDYEEYKEEDMLEFQTYRIKTNTGAGVEVRRIDYRPYKLIDTYKPKILDDCHVVYQLFADDKGIIKSDELFYPKSQLDNIFLQMRKDDLQSQINDIDGQLQDELTPRTKQAIAKLLYALLKEHDYELGATKGNTNDILQSLTKKHDVELSREFIAKQLDEVNKLDKT